MPVPENGAFAITQSVADGIIAHALDEQPNECCGLLIGTADGACEVRRARNLRASPTAFEIDPADHIAAIRSARATGTAVLGAYHSHPRTAGIPSPRDLREATYPDYVYLIVSLAGPAPRITAFRIEDGNFEELPLVIVP